MKILLYCTKAKPYLIQGFAKPFHTTDTTNPFNYKWPLMNYKTQNALNGKIIGECDFEIEKFSSAWYPVNDIDFRKEDIINDLKDNCPKEELEEELEQANLYFNLLKNSCLSRKELRDYVRGKYWFYAIHLKNIKIYEKPKPLQLYSSMQEEYKAIEKAPQNMCNAYYDEGTKHYVLISIRPEWLCKILNGEKTIEIRKVVSKSMLISGFQFHWKKKVSYEIH